LHACPIQDLTSNIGAGVNTRVLVEERHEVGTSQWEKVLVPRGVYWRRVHFRVTHRLPQDLQQ
jgi:hypothetical protein